MTNTTSTVTLAVDSTQVKAADAALDKFAATGTKAETAASALEKTAQGAAAAFGATASGAAAASTATQRVGAGTKAATDGLKATGEQAKLTGYQAAQLSAQLQDLFVQIQAGGSPVTALIQQGSQLSAVFGGFRGALGAVASLLSPVVIGIGSAAAAAGTLAFGLLSGQRQSNELAKALILTGNAAGITEGKFNSLAAAVSKSTNTTIGATRETLQGLVASGRFSGVALDQATRATQLLAKVTGQSTADIVADFTRAADAPGRFAESLNKQYNLLTVSQLSAIDAAEKQGRSQDGLSIILKALNERLGDASKNVGTLESAYDGLASAASRAKDALLGIGRRSTVDDEITSLTEKLQRLRLAVNNQGVANPKEFVASLFGGKSLAEQANEVEKLLERLRESKSLAEQGAKAEADAAKKGQAQIAFNRVLDDSLPKQEKLNKALENANRLADQAGASAEDRARVLAAIRKQFDDGALRRANLEAETSAVQIALQRQTDAYRNAESVLDALRQSGKVADADFYNAKRAFIELTTAEQIKALEAERSVLQRQTVVDADRIQRDTKVRELTASIAKLRADAAAKGLVLSIQETSAGEALARAYDEARIAAQAYLDTLRRGQQQELAGAGIGSAERDRLRARQQIADRYEVERQRVEALKRSTPLLAAEYDKQLQLILDYEKKALESYDDFYAKREQQDADFNVGAREALANYLDSSRQTAKLTETAFSNAFKGAEDALVEFVSTGKTNFKSLVQSVLADLARIQIRQALAGLLSSFGGSGFSTNSTGDQLPTAGGRAIGGPVSSNSRYRILENGPEVLTTGGRSYLMTGSSTGDVKPVQAAEPSIAITINAPGDISPTTAKFVVGQIKQALIAERRSRAYAGA
jgi:lambda family phage tail tape measure protein